MDHMMQLSPSEAEETAAWLADCFAQCLRKELGSRAGVWDRSEPPVVFWYDQAGWLNTAQLVTYLAPTDQHPERPLIVRAALNFFSVPALDFLPAHVGPEEPSAERRGWSLELSALPEEIGRLIPWIVGFSAAQAAGDAGLIEEPPLACRFSPCMILECRYAWTQRAWEAMNVVTQQIRADRLRAERRPVPA